MKYVIDKNNVNLKLVNYNVKISGMRVKPINNVKGLTIKAGKIVLVDSNLRDSYINQVIDKRLDKIIKFSLNILSDEDASEEDGGIVLDGFFSDCAKTIPIGKVSKEAEDLMEITKRALDAGIEACTFGNRIHDISRAVSGVINKKYGIVTDYCGHGVGLSVHEDPSVPNDLVGGANPRLQEGMVLAIEPMINLGTGDVELLDDDWTVVTCDGKISSHQEHTVVVFKDHTEILTII